MRESDFDYLTDNEIDLVIRERTPEDEEKGYVPAYIYAIYRHKSATCVGIIDIRLGYNTNIYYGGNIGYQIEEPYRGNNYAVKACKLIKQVAKANQLNRLYITCNPNNIASRRVCEKLGLILLEQTSLPVDNDLYKRGEREVCIYEWTI